MKKKMFDMDAILAPIPGDNPSGEDMRYSAVYEQIKEARRADDLLDQGAWQRDLKKSDWDLVIKVSSEALQKKTKDLQIAAWLTEALMKKEGFAGLADGFTVTIAFISNYWDTLYPLPDEGDLEYRVGPLEFLNDKISFSIKDIPITEPKVTNGYSWHQWQESRQAKGQDAQLSAEEFDSAVGLSSRDFYIALARDADACMDAFSKLDALVDEKFGQDAPRLSELKQAIEDCQHVVNDILTGKGGRPVGVEGETEGQEQAIMPQQEDKMTAEPGGTPQGAAGQIAEPVDSEGALWKDVQETFKVSGIKAALSRLLNVSTTASSMRQRNRYRLMMAKVALQANRPEISRTILEELYALIQEYHLENWESPIWIAEVIEAYFQCLTAEGSPKEDISKAYGELYPKLCSRDITKALLYKKGG